MNATGCEGADEAAAPAAVVAGLGAPVEILVDRWGVPHIYAQSSDDAFRAQGFNAARDRLWQLDFWRRRGLGLLAEAFGPTLVERDRAARLFLYRGDLAAEWSAYGPETERVVTAFVEGLNAFVRRVLADPALLPLEFPALGYAPALWEPQDVVRIRANGLYDNLDQEVARARTLRDFGPEVENLRRQREPPVDLVLPDGLDLTEIPEDVLRVYHLALDPPDLAAAASARGLPTLQAGSGSAVSKSTRTRPPEGSNNWVLAASRTTTGRPLLANDPHRAVAVPALRYLAHLCAPGLDVVGAGEPALPGISIGHNGHVAFGLTIFPIDQEDLYVYRTDPDSPTRFRYRDGWQSMHVVRETIPVRGEPAAPVELAYTRHGPVIYADPGRATAFAVRAAWLAPGGAPYLGSLAYQRASTGTEFVTALRRWGTPPENHVYADTSGSIGWQPVGLTPARPNWNGTLPVPGDGRYEWAGLRDPGELPAATDPPGGALASANQMILPPDFPAYERVVSFDWAAPSRARRIAAVLDGSHRLSPEDCLRLQSDVVSVPAQRVLRRLARVSAPHGPVAAALDLLTDWDGELAADSPAAALFEVWYRRHLRPGLLRRALQQLVPAGQVDAALQAVLPEETLLSDPRVDLDLLDRPSGRLGPDSEAAVDEVLRDSLGDAVAEVRRLLGQDPTRWSWGRLHAARPVHPLAPLLDERTRARLSVPPVPRGGSGDTVANTAYGADFSQVSGATFRIVVDVGDWDASLVMNSPGQSGDPGSPHYADLVDGWARGDAFPLLYTRAAVEAATEARIVLLPADSTEPL